MTNIIVEDGSLIAYANSYTTISGVDDYATDYGNTAWLTATAGEKKIALFKAMRYIEALPFRGYKQTSAQALEFPRSELYDNNEYLLEENTIPKKLVDAVCEASILSLISSPVELQPLITKDDFVKVERVTAAIGSSYSDKGLGMRSRSTVIEDMLKDFLKNRIVIEIKRG